MGRMSNFPLLLDSCLQLTTGDLSKWGYLKLGGGKKGDIEWTRRFACGPYSKSTVSVYSNLKDDNQPNVELFFSVNDQAIQQKIYLSWQPSNLGKGRVWYFHCPDTGRRCRKLYLVHSHFVSRYAVPEALYDSQTFSKKYRFIDKHYGDYFKSDKAYETINKKYFKRYYKGKPTKKYQAMMDIIERAKSFTAEQIERMYLM